jgi:hypothetical protein
MQKKLTLNIDDELIVFAHNYSKETGVSISKLIEMYLLRLKNPEEKLQFDSKTEMLYGLFKESPIPDKKQLRKEFHEKSTD